MGHGQAAWGYTPRRIAAFLFIAAERRKHEKAEAIWIARAAQASEKEVTKIFKELES